MNKLIDLQRFAEAVQGKQMILLLRVLGDKTAAQILALETEHSFSLSKDAASTATKDGTIRTPGQAEAEISASSVLSVGDTTLTKMKAAMKEDKLIEIWRVNLAEKASTGTNKYKGTYYQGYLTACEESAPADGQVDVSYTFAINGTGEDGEITVTAQQVEEALYAFKDTTAIS